MNSKFDLSEKVALITGGAGLLGKEHAKALLENGAKIILTDIDEIGLKDAKHKLSLIYDHKSIITYSMDVCSEKSISDVLKKIKMDNLKLSILINNAAIDPKVSNDNNLLDYSRLENFSLEQWNLEISVGLTGAFLCSKIFGNEMASESGGVILNIASDLSVISPDQRIYKKAGLASTAQPVKPITYSVIKSGLIGITKYIATYWPDKGIRCNALSPGGVENNQNEDFKKKLVSLIPLGRMAEINEYHSAIQFLCSDASSYMNGQNIVIDGGRSIW